MKWKKPYNNQMRIVERFALLPIRIGNDIVWLETCYIKQHYNGYGDWWKNSSFVTQEDYIHYQKECGKGA